MNNREIIEKVLFPNGEQQSATDPYLQKASAFKPEHLENAVQKLIPGTRVSEIIAMQKHGKGKKGLIFTENGFFDSDFNFLVSKKNHVTLIPYADIQSVTIQDHDKNNICIQYKNGEFYSLYSFRREFLARTIPKILKALYPKQKPEADKSAEQMVQKTSEQAESNEAI